MAKHQHLSLKKSLGQHFLKDEQVLLQIVDEIKKTCGNLPLVEVGPGAGALSKYFLEYPNYRLIEFDERWVTFLKEQYPTLKDKIIQKDFLQLNLDDILTAPTAIVGNFPYNISSQILFKILDYKDNVPFMVGMFQKEVAERVCSPEGSKAYGIISVLLQAFYETEYLFDVPREAFNPPPKVVSGVMKMTRKSNASLPCNEQKFKSVVKLAFNQRRKTLRNSLKSMLNDNIKTLEIFDKRPEQLSVEAFVNLTNIIDWN